eukprot:TRINITY_DN145_c0_g1_i6.p1 TRINITY_DN145_c0_g1~~TRINITY_DN145_c0_g1_i6.p1  ORF type:complete len:381 (+),score=138.93 TRINITY_DN145_c0_g1_i6:75-1145(+)
MAAARPSVSVYSVDSDKATGAKVALPEVFLAPIRHDVVRTVHRDMAKNARQAHGVMRRAGHQATAESWGTGRAVARIPRASGGGTHRSGQGAYGNMCRGGHMFGALKTFRRWHRRVARDQRRYATVSAIAASALPALVQARGHNIDDVPELPLVVDNAAAAFKKTRHAVKMLSFVEAQDDCERVASTQKIRPGKGKWRNRRYVSRRGPLIVFADNDGKKAFQNVPGVDTCNVNALNLLQLAPGGHVGRFVIWTQAAFEALPKVFGGFDEKSKVKRGYSLPRHTMTVSDVSRILNSAEVQGKCRPKRRSLSRRTVKTNALSNKRAAAKLNPYRVVLATNKKRQGVKKAAKAKKAVKA